MLENRLDADYWRLILRNPSKNRGSEAGEPAEHAGEMLLMREAAGQGDLNDREGALQHPLGALDAKLDEELVRRHAGGDFEAAREVGRAEGASSSDIDQ